jgi:phosphoribosylglycinamide formyltransferase-1
MQSFKNLAVFASGTGTLFEAMLKEDIPVAFFLADRRCRALDIATEAGIPSALLERDSFGKDFDRKSYTREVLKTLRARNIDLVAMAGFMTVLSPEIFTEFRGTILNTHPSLLPLFKGGHAVKDALEAGAKETGTTIHIATTDLDAGPIVARAKVPVLAGDSVERLHDRIKTEERKLYPQVLKDILAGTLALPKAGS